MKKALTLIELIFTIVILSMVAMVVPKMLYVSNQILEFTNKEDAIFNLMAKTADVIFKEYDENNTLTDAILLNKNKDLDCNSSTGYRIGGYKGGRNCLFSSYTQSKIGLDTNEPPEDDIDDYNKVEENITHGHKLYTLKIYVGYTDEWNKTAYKNTSLNYKFSKNFTSSTNIKRIYITISKKDENISSISYYSTNIGHAIIKSVLW